MAEVGKILESLREASSGLDAAMAATRRGQKHAREVEQRLGRTGLRRMATEMGQVVKLMAKCGQAMVADQKLLAELATRTALVPDDASPDEVAASLGLVSGELQQLAGRLPGTAKNLDDSQAIVAMVLKGARPGPLLGRIEEIRAPLTGVLGSVEAARKCTDEMIAEVRDAGRVGGGAASTAAGTIALSSTDPTHRRQLNKPPPNSTVVVDERFQYETDEQGRVVRATATLDLIDLEHPRSKSAQRTLVGKLPGDHAGHLFARIFQGPLGKINLTPMEGAKVNLGQYATLEKVWRKEIEAGRSVKVFVELEYPGDDRRPDIIEVGTEIGGRIRWVTIENKPKPEGSTE
ncbi:DNA/RNA non-specific endonuclease [Nocardioides speluncae]|uniref:DNA/RNA non-specific endonuclease n=1 Tax=Nocardioides speluncae TaxID=2670337 RepID=UPI00137A26A1|nr:DNA/RNA non-specific endonuclease [Nocardioides speluncae]